MEQFADRVEAGKILANYLMDYKGQSEAIVLALPRGGVPVAEQVANALELPLDVFIVRKIGMPGHPEFAIGAIASGGFIYLNQPLIQQLQLDQHAVDAVIAREKEELARRAAVYRGDKKPLELFHKTVIIVDDGMATGSTMQAAVLAIKMQLPKKIIAAIPVASREAVASLNLDDVVCPLIPENFQAVGLWYQAFPQVSDEEVNAILAK